MLHRRKALLSLGPATRSKGRRAGRRGCVLQRKRSSHRLVDGCSTGGRLYSAWGLPRAAKDDERVGEAVCCNEKGALTAWSMDAPQAEGSTQLGACHAQQRTTSR